MLQNFIEAQGVLCRPGLRWILSDQSGRSVGLTLSVLLHRIHYLVSMMNLVKHHLRRNKIFALHMKQMTNLSDAQKSAAKRETRQQAVEALRRLSKVEMAEESAAIAENLRRMKLIQTASRIAIYVHCERLREVDTSQILEEALSVPNLIKVYVPRVQDKDANMHFLHISSLEDLKEVPPFGIREPDQLYPDGTPREDANTIGAPLDLVIMPGLAFDRKGLRLGRGGGYYDKFIALCKSKAAQLGKQPPLLVALAFQAQIFETVPTDELDQPIDILVTAHGVGLFSERAATLGRVSFPSIPLIAQQE